MKANCFNGSKAAAMICQFVMNEEVIMNSAQFNLCNKNEVLIYGAGAFGRSIYDKIREVYTIRGFIDRRKIIVKHDLDGTIPVYSLNELDGSLDYTVIICVHNAEWHHEIAEKLYALGFDKILFLAVHASYDQGMARCMNRAYALFLENSYELLTAIPRYNTLLEESDSQSIIRKSKDYVVAFCDRKIIFSFDHNDIDTEAHNMDKVKMEHEAYNNCLLSALGTYLSLMEFFMYGKGTPEKYISLMKDMNNSFEMSETSFLEDQWKVYELLEREYEKGMDAFQYSPIDVKWNKRGYFNILDGHHRATFYYLKGLHNFPVRMKITDYEEWLNADKLAYVKSALKTTVPKTLISNPYFSRISYEIHEGEETVIEMIFKYVYENGRNYIGLLDASAWGGEFARFFYRTNKAENIISLANKGEYELQKSLNELYYIPEEKLRVYEGDINDLMECFQCAVICGRYDIDELEQIRNFWNNSALSEIYWSSKMDIEKEKKFILNHTQFTSYQFIGQKCINGRLCELGVFRKNGK